MSVISLNSLPGPCGLTNTGTIIDMINVDIAKFLLTGYASRIFKYWRQKPLTQVKTHIIISDHKLVNATSLFHIAHL